MAAILVSVAGTAGRLPVAGLRHIARAIGLATDRSRGLPFVDAPSRLGVAATRSLLAGPRAFANDARTAIFLVFLLTGNRRPCEENEHNRDRERSAPPSHDVAAGYDATRADRKSHP